MKAILLMVAILLGAETGARAQTDLRLVGTNLYDFTYAGPAFLLGSNPDYPMQIVKRYPQSIQVEIHTEMEVFIPNIGYWNDPSDGPTGIKQVDYALSGGQRQAEGTWDSYIQTNTIYILHPPAKLPCLAVPIKPAGFWDCGEPFTGDTNQFKYIYRVGKTAVYISKL
jgi:hypothetical protein